MTDPLTGLGNYRRLVEALDAEVKRTGPTVLRVFCRAIDTATRHGGDEFAVILPERKAAGARLVAHG